MPRLMSSAKANGAHHRSTRWLTVCQVAVNSGKAACMRWLVDQDAGEKGIDDDDERWDQEPTNLNLTNLVNMSKELTSSAHVKPVTPGVRALSTGDEN
ncbi:hypothetical protein RRG08_017157 [Elysia crispata]|uniref:Uncharacterized protein n=1 Tax=Elysia crispata TaxID=231223 RepID=A0AAE1E8V8_9GAST|nr:hypothetical protein RRG08_017157 [Elysia crispata]